MLPPLIPFLALLLEDAPPTETKGGGFDPLPLVAVAAIFYFVLILPGRKERKKREELLGGLKKGDEVMMKSGLYGKIVLVNDDRVRVQVADGVRVDFAREAVQSVIDPAAAKEAKGDKDAAADEPAESKSVTVA